MKILKRCDLTDRVLGRVTCQYCTSELEVTMGDLRAQQIATVTGPRNAFCFVCPVCTTVHPYSFANDAERLVCERLRRIKPEVELASANVTTQPTPDNESGKLNNTFE